MFQVPLKDINLQHDGSKLMFDKFTIETTKSGEGKYISDNCTVLHEYRLFLNASFDFQIHFCRFEIVWEPEQHECETMQPMAQIDRLIEAFHKLFNTKLCGSDDFIMRFSINGSQMFGGGTFGFTQKHGIKGIIQQLVQRYLIAFELI